MSDHNDDGDAPRRDANGRFVRGASGNPRGRPPAPRTLGVPNQILRDVLDIAEQVVDAAGPNGRRKVTKGKLVVEAIFASAMKGRAASQRLWVDWMKTAYKERMERHPILEVAEIFRQMHEDPNGDRDPAHLGALDEWVKRLKRL